MARSNRMPDMGHNHRDLTDDEMGALVTSFTTKVIDHVLKDTVDDAIAAEAAGYRAGRRADDPVMPDHINPIFAPDFQKGWTRGQEVNAKAEAMAAEILARPQPGVMVEGENPDETEDGDDENEDLDAEVKRLESTGWHTPTEGEAEFEESDGGKTIRQPRAGRKSQPDQAAA